MTPLVSVVMPCHNDGAYLAEAAASLRASTWPALELIVVDDGSDDAATRAALAALDFPALTRLRTEHVGPAAARNAAIRAAKGTFILPLDADDRIEPDYIEKAAAVLLARPEVGAVYCHADFIGAKMGPWTLPEWSPEAELLDSCVFVTALFRRADWEAAGGFSEDFPAGLEDYDFWLSLMDLGREIVQLPETLFHYRIKQVSRSTRFSDDEAAVRAAFDRLWARHRGLFMAHMDTLFPALRARVMNQDAALRRITEDPVTAYWASVRLLKPRRAERFARWLRLKERIKKRLGR